MSDYNLLDKYCQIFPALKGLDEQLFREHYSVHLYRELYLISNKISDKNKKSEIEKTLSFLCNNENYLSLEELEKIGFDENEFYEKLNNLMK